MSPFATGWLDTQKLAMFGPRRITTSLPLSHIFLQSQTACHFGKPALTLGQPK